ncbi:MAG: type II toxin-antitoxin system VapC family toxin [Acidobacteria bacterium]|nr:type II toxin-antitoxin system VapC family toxin [Acidobacteriota bacterium]
MIAIDTNVLVRFVVEDDPVQTERATRVFRRAIEANDPCYVSDVVLCETVWVLETTYKFRRREIVPVLESLLHASHLTFSARDCFARALEAYASGRGDFADYMIREHARSAGCDFLITFEKVLLKEPGFAAP